MAIRNGKPCMEAIKRMCTEFKPEKAWTEVYAYLTVCLPLAQQRP